MFPGYFTAYRAGSSERILSRIEVGLSKGSPVQNTKLIIPNSMFARKGNNFFRLSAKRPTSGCQLPTRSPRDRRGQQGPKQCS